MKSITIIDPEYKQWLSALSQRYRRSQLKAAVRVNTEMLQFYWSLGKDMVEMHIEERWGEKVMTSLARDLKTLLPEATGLSRSNLYYIKKFYLMYSGHLEIVQQAVGQLPMSTEKEIVQQAVGQIAERHSDATSLLGEQIMQRLFSVPWGHHVLLMDKCNGDVGKAFFYINKVVQEGWSRSVLLNILDTDLYERQGKAITNFDRLLPDETSELAQELTRDPYNFAFTGIRDKYNEDVLKAALLENITQFLIELGTGFAYVGKEYRLPIGAKDKYIDLLFYNLTLSCYIVVEVKIGEFDFKDMGQLSGYVVACNHILRKEGRDNPTIGLLICKQKDNLLAQYAVEGCSQPIGISEYQLAQLYPTNVEGTIPTIEEIEKQLEEKSKNTKK